MEIPRHNKVPADLIARFFNGNADTDDIIDLEKWKSLSIDNLKLFEESRRIWERTGHLSILSEIDTENEWDVYLEPLKENYKTTEPEGKTLRRRLIRIVKILAFIILIGYSSWYFYHVLKFETVTAKNEILDINMPDGSIVSLNKNSSIRYTKNFKNTRSLILNGEAFFQAQSDSENPFIIKAGEVSIEALGTSFNVIAPKNESLVQVMVKEGKIAVYNNSNKPVRRNILNRGEHVIFSRKSGVRSIQSIRDLNYISWKTGVYHFENVTLQYVLKLFENNFQTIIELKNPVLNNYTVNINFDNKSLFYMLQAVCDQLNLKVLRTSKGYLIEG